MNQFIPIIYVGKKPFSFDNVSSSGKSWQGYGDVQEVTPPQAKLLLQHPGQWALADSADADLFDAPVTVSVTNSDGETEAVNVDALTKPLEKMTKPELMAYALNRFGKTLDASTAKKQLLDQVQEFEHDLAPKVGVPAAQ